MAFSIQNSFSSGAPIPCKQNHEWKKMEETSTSNQTQVLQQTRQTAPEKQVNPKQ